MKIALLGFGVVGQGFYDIFKSQQESLQEEFNQEIIVGKVLVKPNEVHEKYSHLPFTNDFNDILDYKPDVVISAMGGNTTSYTFASKVIANGSSFITSNKDLIASYYDELHLLAKENNVRILFEAAVGGTIPLLKTIREDLRGNDFISFQGIVNGTTNYILSSMANDNINYEEALTLAQEKGFAESDPSSDVEGKDAIRKTAILINQMFKQSFNDEDINGSGITKLSKRMIDFTTNNNAKIKLLAYAFKDNEGLHTSVRPVIVCSSHPLYYVDYEINEVILEGNACGTVKLTGSGAGRLTTGSAVFSDLYDLLLKPNHTVKYNPTTALNLDNSYETNACFLPNEPLKVDSNENVSFISINNDILIEAYGEKQAKKLLQTYSESTEVHVVLC